MKTDTFLKLLIQVSKLFVELKTMNTLSINNCLMQPGLTSTRKTKHITLHKHSFKRIQIFQTTRISLKLVFAELHSGNTLFAVPRWGRHCLPWLDTVQLIRFSRYSRWFVSNVVTIDLWWFCYVTLVPLQIKMLFV